MPLRLILLLLLPFSVFAGSVPAPLPVIQARETHEEHRIDGVLDELHWQQAQLLCDFYQQYPFDSSAAKARTDVMVSYDKDHILVGAICYIEPGTKHVVQSLRRDFEGFSDVFEVYMDPFNDQTNGFSFAVNPMGVQREGLIQWGGSMGISTAWDNVWYSEVTRTDTAWIVEMAIPLRTLRFKEGSKEWRINFSRIDLHRNEASVWSRVPRNFEPSSLAFTGKVQFETPLKRNGGNIALIPYGITTADVDHTTDPDEYAIKPNAGMDAKVAVTSSLNLDLTVNPDFAQVDVDRQITNLSRFSLFFPERRSFFLENSDLFDRFGFRQIRPFFSRRIGLDNGMPVPILFGARLSGKINRDWRIGLMNMQTEGGVNGQEGQNYTVAAAQYQLKGRSNLSAIFVNRQGFSGNDVAWSDFNRLAGLDYNIANKDNSLMGKLFFHHSFGPEKKDNAFAHASWIHYETAKVVAEWNHEYVGHNYDAQVGFVPRISYFDPLRDTILKRSYLRLEPYAAYKFYPQSDLINNHGPMIYLSEYFDGQYQTMERFLRPSYTIAFQNSAMLETGVDFNKVRLFFDQDITFSGNKASEAGWYDYTNFSIDFTSDRRKKFTYGSSLNYGGYFNGHKTTTSAEVNYRVQPWGIFSLTAEFNGIDMPNTEGFNDVQLWLFGPKLDLSFTRKIFVSTFVQYNSQINNVSVYSRLQYRFKPMSDLFIVYTSNVNAPKDVNMRNQALAVKLVWWISL